MSRLPVFTTIGLLLIGARPGAGEGPVIDSMDTLRFAAPKDAGKGQVVLVEGKVGKAVRFSFAKDARSSFATSNIRGTPEWDRADGFSFWVQGDGSDSFGALQF